MNSQLRNDIENTCHIEPAEGFADLISLHHANPERYPFLLESVAQGSSEARYDILFSFPQDSLILDNKNDLSSSSIKTQGSDFLTNLDAWWDGCKNNSEKENNSLRQDLELPFQGGWFIYLGYELAGQIEPVLNLPINDTDDVVAYAVRIPAAIIRDHVTQRCWLVSEASHQDTISLMHDDIAKAKKLKSGTSTNNLLNTINEEEARNYISAVDKIRRYIVEGDVFQVNLSRQWSATLNEQVSDSDLYLSLRENNPAPFSGIANFAGCSIISSSPERLISVKNGCIETRPIAGTRPRGEELASDQALSVELLAHPKERAEHIMLIDLERNDLGRVCKAGSINVNELMVLESYAHVHHIVSNIRGQVRDDASPGDIIRAVFPGGTITGCPKVRCMEIIAELEQTPRGAYTGSMGYLNRNGDMDFNILIRTMTRQGSHLQLRAGAGIVADSIAENELTETRTKAKGLLNALGANTNT
ncbi:MAG: aminodeoxychorismate synthase component I [Sulfuriflexus sp.]|nr:aminodeoxychorismate synthase component I [Sulfuriflexus sp.]